MAQAASLGRLSLLQGHRALDLKEGLERSGTVPSTQNPFHHTFLRSERAVSNSAGESGDYAEHADEDPVVNLKLPVKRACQAD